MASDCGKRSIQTVVFMFNVVFVIGGLAMICAGTVTLNNTSIFPWTSSLPTAAVLVIVIGCLVFVISFIACWAAVHESFCLMVTHFALLIFLLMYEIGVATAGFLLRDQVRSNLETAMFSTMQLYENNTNAMQNSWDILQNKFDCCGVFNASDWQNQLPSWPYSVPSSCCLPNTARIANCSQNVLLLPQSAQQNFIYTEGCFDSLVVHLKENWFIVGVACIFMVTIQLAGVILSACLANEFRKNYESLS